MSIFSWIKSIFSPKSQSNVAISDNLEQEKNNSEIVYRKNLVDNLKHDHQNLLSLYGVILKSANELKYTEIIQNLEEFKLNFSTHLQAENVKLYVFLEQHLKNEDEEFKKMRKYRREMRDIESAVNKFLNSWIESGVTQHTVAEFKQQLKSIGEALVKRIESEETSLYPMYNQKS